VRRITNLCLFAIGIVTAAVGGACGSSEMSLSPTAPSSVGTSAGAVISGRVSGVTAAATSMGTFSVMESQALTVSVVGTNISTTINGTGQFTLSGVPAGTVTLKFSGSGVDATVTLSGVTATDRIDITVNVTGGNARVESERRGRGNGADGRVELNGPVASLNGGGCPAVSFMVQGTRVNTNSATVFDDITCATLANGVQVEAEGQRQSDGSVLASRVEGKDTNNREQRMEGVVSARAGTCPAITFTVLGTKVTTSSATRFKDTSCTNVVDGRLVEIRGQRQADGSFLASRVEPDDDDDDDDDEDDD
jgi:uncharacterized protein DUF5666